MEAQTKGKESRQGSDGETMPLLPRDPQNASIPWSFWHLCNFALPFLVIGIGVVGLSYLEGWSVIVSCYVIAQIVTTIGYGDFTVTSEAAKVFMSFYAIVCLIILAYYLNLFCTGLVEKQSAILKRYMRHMEVAMTNNCTTTAQAKAKFGSMNTLMAAGILFSTNVVAGTIFYRLYEHCVCANTTADGCVDADFETCRATGGYVKTMADSFYMSVITLLTVGFGDYQPRSFVGRFVGISWMFIGVASTGFCMTVLTTFFYESSSHEKFNASENLSAIDSRVFDKIDRNHSGNLSRGEFLAYTLVKYGLVEEELINEINGQYDKIDVLGTNKVTMEMISARRAQTQAMPSA